MKKKSATEKYTHTSHPTSAMVTEGRCTGANIIRFPYKNKKKNKSRRWNREARKNSRDNDNGDNINNNKFNNNNNNIMPTLYTTF